MTDSLDADWQDPLSAPFWAGAREHRLLLQRCASCGRFQHYPRPFCVRCESDDVAWVESAGHGTVYSVTRNHLQVSPDLPTPYLVGLVELDEGLRLMTNFVDECAIGDEVTLAWRERDQDLPPLPIFRRHRAVRGACDRSTPTDSS